LHQGSKLSVTVAGNETTKDKISRKKAQRAQKSGQDEPDLPDAVWPQIKHGWKPPG
jgi:hypothetical protein